MSPVPHTNTDAPCGLGTGNSLICWPVRRRFTTTFLGASAASGVRPRLVPVTGFASAFVAVPFAVAVLTVFAGLGAAFSVLAFFAVGFFVSAAGLAAALGLVVVALGAAFFVAVALAAGLEAVALALGSAAGLGVAALADAARADATSRQLLCCESTYCEEAL